MRAVDIALDAWDTWVSVVFLGDLHLGNRGVDEALVEATAKRLQGERCYWVDLGDAIDAINLSDPRFEATRLPDWIGLADLDDLAAAQVSRYRHYFGKLGGNCLARLYGNHEYVLQKHYERDLYAALNASIGLPTARALGYSGFVRLRFRDMCGEKVRNTWTQTLYLTHGSGGGKLAGSKAGGLERLALAYAADVYACGHTHTKLVLQKRRVGLSSRKAETESQALLMLNVGAFLNGDTGYPERNGLYPQALGPIEVRFLPSERRLEVLQ